MSPARRVVAKTKFVLALQRPEDSRETLLKPKSTKDTPPKRQRPSYWPVGVDSELEMALLTRIERAGLPLGEGQHRFVPGRMYRFDRCWPAQRVAVEVQGGIWTGGRHARGSGIAAECVKLSIAAALGWRVLLVTDEMIQSGQAVELLAQALEPAPATAPAGHGGVSDA